jgi:5-methylcytosine-specific restriction endonuclease McrA
MKKNIFGFDSIAPASFKFPPLYPEQDVKDKPKRTPCPQAVKEALWRKYFGSNMDGNCYVCKESIKFTNFEPGHNTPASKGGKWSVTNLRPLCRTCNRSMGDKMTVEAFKKKHFVTKPKTKVSKAKVSPKSKTGKLKTTKTKK